MHLIATLKARLSIKKNGTQLKAAEPKSGPLQSPYMEHVFAPLQNYDKYLQTQAANAPISTVT